MLAQDLLTRVRYTLSDTDKDRWTDARLISLLNEGILDIAKNTILFIETVFYQVSNLVFDIDLTSQSLKVLRAEYLDDPLPFYSFEEADLKFGTLWQQHTGDKVKAIIYDKQRNGILKQYPICSNALNPHIEYNSLLGVVTDISYSDILPILANVYGDISHVPDEALIKFYYIRKHAAITALSDTLSIDELTDIALKHYICGMALRDNQDTQSRTMAQEELAMYYSKVEEYSMQRSKDFAQTDYTARYRPND